MNKGFTLIELVMTVIVISILGAFTFSVIWEYSSIYASTRQGFIYGEAAAVMERITRELRDAQNVDNCGVYGGGDPHSVLTFQPTHGTPAMGTPANPPHWVQYCLAQLATPGVGTGQTRALLYRVELNSGTPPFADQCTSAVPVVGGAGGTIVAVALMSSHIMSLHGNGSVTVQGFQVYDYMGSPGGVGTTHEIKLSLTADPTQRNIQDGAQYTSNPSITLVSQVSPRNYAPYNPGNNPPSTATGDGSDRSFSGNYYDEIK
ncbi:MAG TPA: type II secretion system protein [Syntrophorhabdales bacterium]|nr:type II secretion system protein [Syntrophorhabdales bacterium]